MGNELQTQKAPAPKNIVDRVGEKIRSLVASSELALPDGYSAGNALKEAFLVLQQTEDRNKRPVLEVCTNESIASALLETVVMGLSPARKQVYYIAYGQKLTAQRSYMGNLMLARRLNKNVADIFTSVIRDGDDIDFEMVNGIYSNISHKTSFANMSAPIVGAYAVAVDALGNNLRSDIMTIEDIHGSWKQSKMNPVNQDGTIKGGSTHGKFEAQMAEKTVANRLCKKLINTSPDNGLVTETLAHNSEQVAIAEVDLEIDTFANKKAIDFEEIPEVEIESAEEVAAEANVDTETGEIFPDQDPFGDEPC